MKTKMITLLLLSFTVITFAQEGYLDCATPQDSNPDPVGIYSYTTPPESILEIFDPVVLNVKFWKVNDPNGDFYVDFSEDKLLEGIAHLNLNYNQFNIFFKYRGWEEFDSPNDVIDRRWEDLDGDGNYSCGTYPDPDPNGFTILDRCQIYGSNGLFGWASNNGYRDSTAMNIYVTSWNAGFGNAAGDIGHNQLVVKTGSLGITGMTHEMGHALGLYHTRSSNEHVTRDPSDTTNYNATDAGDRVVDTAANPGFRKCDENGEYCYPYILADCTYDPDSPELDNSTPQRLYSDEMNPEDVINVMGNAYDCAENYFTNGQAVRMRETINNLSILQNTKTNVAALYEPYRGNYPAYYPYPQPWELPLFQPGFKYVFVECDGEYPQPAPYGEIFNYDLNNILLFIDNDETNYNSIIHPNHAAIYLKHEYNGNNVFPIPQKCYNNWNSPPIIGGSIIKFNDNVFNTNVTITTQDSTSINNEELIDNLQPGLYNIIKNYENGDSQETVILKENN